MRNVLAQIIAKYPEKTVVVNLEDGGSASGRAYSLIPAASTAASGGLLLLANSQGVVQEAVSICKIAFVSISGAAYDNTITYNSLPNPIPGGCESECQAAIASYIPTGTENVMINAGGKSTGQGNVIKSVYGMIVLAGANNMNPTFVSTCKIEVIKKGKTTDVSM